MLSLHLCVCLCIILVVLVCLLHVCVCVCVCVSVACIVGAIPLGRMITLHPLDVVFDVFGSRSGPNTVNSLKFKTESQQSS